VASTGGGYPRTGSRSPVAGVAAARGPDPGARDVMATIVLTRFSEPRTTFVRAS
jgi:hypothetical protein